MHKTTWHNTDAWETLAIVITIIYLVCKTGIDQVTNEKHAYNCRSAFLFQTLKFINIFDFNNISISYGGAGNIINSN